MHQSIASTLRSCLSFVATVLLLVVALTGCGEDDSQRNAGGDAGSDTSAKRRVSIAAASDLKFALDDVITAFKSREPNIDVQVAYGSSGNFFSQLSNNAPFDVFLSADIEYPRKLIAAGLGLKETEFLYGIGQIVVWVPNSSTIDVEKLGIRALTQAGVEKVAIANPQHAPYGRAAEAAMRKLGVYEAVADRLVLGENISQTAQFVESGAADVGVIALSLALAPSMRAKGRYWSVPVDAYPRLEQGGVVLSWAQDRAAATSFIAYLNGSEGRSTLREYGFIMPGE